jgi:type I restriction enzyme S subunit
MNEVAELSQNYLVGADSNAVPAGYKQTEVGVIPEDWSLVTLGSIFNFKNGLNKEKHYFGYGTPIVNYMDVYESGGIHCSSVKGLVCVTPVEKKNYSAKRGDVFFTRTSETVEEIGLASVLLDDLRNAVFSGFVLRARQLKETFVPLFMKYCFRHELARKQIQSTASYTTRALTNGNLLSNVYVTVPSKKEQTAIANALSDVDALISELEKLIAKKQAIKTATMQQLLTGRTRLPQFALREDGTPKGTKPSELGEIPEDWEVVTLGTASSFINGRAYSLHEWENSGTPVIRLQNLTGRGDEYYYSNLQLPEKQYCKSGDLLFMWSATFGPVIWRGPKAIYHYHIWKIACEVGYGQSYLFYLLDDMTEKLKRSSSSGGTMLHVTKEKMESTKAAFPSYEEQTAIATILSDMDAEIQALEQRLGKTRQIKQGMMQELLTGKTRLIKPSKEVIHE